MIDFEEYFWLLKSFFPGSPEFSIEKYSALPYSYVISAVTNGARSYSRQLEDYERPIALLTATYVNSQRDPKKRGKPSSYLDFSFYKSISSDKTPLGHNGAAYIELIKRKMLPSWALFCYKAMASGASKDYIPDHIALIAEDAILLHPQRSGKSYTGLLIAMESASHQIRTFRSTEGETMRLRVPEVDTKTIARENEILTP